ASSDTLDLIEHMARLSSLTSSHWRNPTLKDGNCLHGPSKTLTFNALNKSKTRSIEDDGIGKNTDTSLARTLQKPYSFSWEKTQKLFQLCQKEGLITLSKPQRL